mgnify:CR=1 FL=1
MAPIAAIYRCLLLLFLPFMTVFSVVYLTTGTSVDKTSTLATVLSTKTAKSKPCHEYKVEDSRPFFEREPPQMNLPRRISNTTRDDLYRRLRSLRLALVACAYNVEKDVDKFRKYTEPIIDLFHPTSRIFIIESDSTDNTLAKLRKWSRAEVSTYGNLSRTIPFRTERIAYCRNRLLEKARQIQPDYLLMLDLDIFAANVSSFLTNFEYNTNSWAAMTANLIETYYDIWALRTLSESILNYDVWHRIMALQFTKAYCDETLQPNIVSIHQKRLPADRDLLEVRSGFDGAGLYRMDAIEDCWYTGESYQCEHVPFHICIREKNQGRIFINPKFTNYNM